MRTLRALCVLLAAASTAAAADLAELKKQFTKEEGVLLQALLHVPENAQAFVQQGNSMPPADFQAAWRLRLADWATNYLGSPRRTNMQARNISEVGEPAEWAMLMESMRVNAGQWKTEYFRDQVIRADEELKRGDTKRTEWVVKKAREFLVDNLNEFLASDNAKQAQRRRQELQQRNQQQDEERRRREAEENARRQAEEAARNAARARQAPTPEAALGQTGTDFDGGAPRQASPVVVASPVDETPQQRAAVTAPQPGDGQPPLAPSLPPAGGLTGPTSGPGAPGASGLGGPTVPAPAGSDDLAELRSGRTGAASGLLGNSGLIGAGIGALAGGLIALLFAAPILLAAAIGAAVGFGASMLLNN